jgi:ElaB/YqjD/DUF883 family membrane-anchored ribosome-binding protein
MASRNPFVYLIELFSKKIQTYVTTETADLKRKQLELREDNLERIYASEKSKEDVKRFREKLTKLSEKKEKLEKNEDSVSVIDRIISAIKKIKAGFTASEAAANASAAGPGFNAFVAAKTQAFLEKLKSEAEYIEKVAKKQKEFIKEDLQEYKEQLGKLIDEVNRGRDDYRDEILSQLPQWAQSDPFIADAPNDSILKRYNLRRQSRELRARKEQKAN